MNTEAICMLIGAQGLVISLMCYFFYRVLKTPPKPEPDSYSDNDDIER